MANAYHSSALGIQTLLAQGLAAGAALSLEPASLENERLLEVVRAAEAAALARPAADFLRKCVPAGLASVGARASLGGGGGGEAALERDKLRAEVEALRSRLQALQVGTTAAMRDKAEMAQQLEAAREEAAAARRAALRQESAAAAAAPAAAAREALERQLAAANEETSRALDLGRGARSQLTALQQKLHTKAGEAAQLEAAAAERLAASKQFRQLQQLMKAKSEQVVELRRRLARYEPEQVSSADEPPR